MILRQITAPAHEPLTLSDVEGQLRIGSLSDESTTVELYIQAVRKQAEKITRRALITQQWELVLDEFPPEIKVPRPPLQTIDSIKYIDTDGVEQTLDPTYYKVDTANVYGRIVPSYQNSWPTVRDEIASIRVRFTCGYGPIAPETSDNVPADIRLWMLMQIGGYYENREPFLAMARVQLVEFKSICDGLLDDYRVFI